MRRAERLPMIARDHHEGVFVEPSLAQRVEETAKKRGNNNAQIATSWLLAKGGTAPIVGASKMKHLEDAIAAAEIRLTGEEVAYLEEPYKPKAVAGNLR